MDITINNEQKVQVTLAPVDQENRPAPLVGVPTWTVQSGDATLAVAADGLSAFLISGTNVADSTVLVGAEGDPTPGVDHLSGQITLHVINPEASILGLTVGTPVPK